MANRRIDADCIGARASGYARHNAAVNCNRIISFSRVN